MNNKDTINAWIQIPYCERIYNLVRDLKSDEQTSESDNSLCNQ
jgi:hypothetical protein